MATSEFSALSDVLNKQPGIWVWRIEAMKCVLLETKPDLSKNPDACPVGTFYKGDSYICLKSVKVDNALLHDIHFWLGSETSKDEMGVAAYKTVELDDFMGGAPVQHREVEGHESPEFLAMWNSFGGMKLKEGGVASGFKKVEKKDIKELLHVKGKRSLTVTPVKCETKSLNTGDVFILNMGDTGGIYVWNGDQASKTEKIKGMQTAQQMNGEQFKNQAKITVLEEKGSGPDHDHFFKMLGGRGPIAAATNDEEHEKRRAMAKTLYQCSDASGKFEVKEISKGLDISRDHLKSEDVFVLDAGAAGIFVWVGKGATKEEKSKAYTTATGFIESKGYPSHTQVTKVSENNESLAFQNQFPSWPANMKAPPRPRQVEQKVDASALHKTKAREPQKQVDDGSGKLEIWRVEDFKPVPVPEAEYGTFYAGDSYVMMYTYTDKNVEPPREAYLIYFWQGNDSSQDEKGASALIAKEFDDAKGGLPVQVRVVQNKEPDHFLLLFKGKFIIKMGGKGTGFKNLKAAGEGGDNYDTDGTSLYHVRGTSELNTKAVQVAEVAASLNSNDCFVLEKPKNVYVWHGQHATAEERATAMKIAERLAEGRPVEAHLEGQEKSEFWDALGGKDGFVASEKRIETTREPRLFQCSNASGKFAVDEIFDYVQEDLDEEDVFLLDTWDNIYVWIGEGSLPEEKKKALETAVEYLKADGTRNPEDIPLLTVKQGFEPAMFTSCFVWDAEKARNNTQDYEKIKAQIMASGGSGVTSAADELNKYSAKHSWETLKKRPLPEGVDPVHIEDSLDDDEFQKAFKMDRAAFKALPKWKSDGLKKTAGVF